LVRFEAIVSIARRSADPRLTDALVETLEGNDPALSTTAAWGLGRIGDERALEALRQGLGSRYRSVQAHCARSLGSLGDRSVLPLFLERLATEEDVGLQMALASALGQLGATEALGRLLDLLRASRTGDARTEFALAVARLTGDEHPYIQLQRRVAADPGTALSQAATGLGGKLGKSQGLTDEAEEMLERAAEALAQEEVERGVALLAKALQSLPAGGLATACGAVVRECTVQMEIWGPERMEYVLLGLHALECVLAAG
jgi:HEAT repeat protein